MKAASNRSISERARWKVAMGLNSALVLVLAALLLAMINYLSARHFVRWDWSRSHFYELSDKTRALLAGLKDPVNVTVLFEQSQPDYEDVERLLREYQYASPQIRIEFVDPDRDIARADALAQRYKIDSVNVVIFEQNGRARMVGASELSALDYSEVMQTGRARVAAFRGEQVFSSAIMNVSQSRTPIVYFLQGHGERDPDSQNRPGYSTIRREIIRDNVTVRKLVLGVQSSIPADADALIIAAPKVAYAESEVALLRSYLDKDGRLMALFDTSSNSGLEPLLEDWGVGVGNSMVVDPTRTLGGSDLFIRDYYPHPITRNIRSETCVFYLPRAVQPLAAWTNEVDRKDKPTVSVLCVSSPESWAEMDGDQHPVRFDKGRDFPGPIPLAVAAERGPIAGLDVTVRPARLVVFGDADFVANAPFTGGNRDFFMSALNWLLEREDLLSIAAKPLIESRLLMDATQLQEVFWIVVVGIPAAMATLGILVWMRRRI